ncbi:hypothetical protein ACWCYL_30235, partial [Streptomyces sp. 900105755]
AAERRALSTRPPDILITTPESLFLMLTSATRPFRGAGNCATSHDGAAPDHRPVPVAAPPPHRIR